MIRRLACLAALAVAACGGDDSGEQTTTAPTSVSASATTQGTSSTAGGSTDEDSSTTSPSSSGSTTAPADTGSSSTGGPPADPNYPPPDPAGACPGNTAEIQLGGATACAPFCDGPTGACPAPATGTAGPVCTPFEQPGGSGIVCTDISECGVDEACIDGTCESVAFWACRLECPPPDTCPDAMVCSAGACGYP